MVFKNIILAIRTPSAFLLHNYIMMPVRIKKWITPFLIIACQVSSGFAFSPNGDSLRLDINDAYFSGSYVEIPVTIFSFGNVFAVDFAFRYDFNRLVFDDVVNAMPGLQYLYYQNPIDSIWRFTSYLPNGFQFGTSVCHLRFLTLSNEACAYDFTVPEGYINGDSCVMEIQGCMDNLGLTNLDVKDLTIPYPNPFSDQLFLESKTEKLVHIFDCNGVLILKTKSGEPIHTGSWPVGMYYVKIFDRQFHHSFKMLKQSP